MRHTRSIAQLAPLLVLFVIAHAQGQMEGSKPDDVESPSRGSTMGSSKPVPIEASEDVVVPHSSPPALVESTYRDMLNTCETNLAAAQNANNAAKTTQSKLDALQQAHDSLQTEIADLKAAHMILQQESIKSDDYVALQQQMEALQTEQQAREAESNQALENLTRQYQESQQQVSRLTEANAQLQIDHAEALAQQSSKAQENVDLYRQRQEIFVNELRQSNLDLNEQVKTQQEQLLLVKDKLLTVRQELYETSDRVRWYHERDMYWDHPWEYWQAHLRSGWERTLEAAEPLLARVRPVWKRVEPWVDATKSTVTIAGLELLHEASLLWTRVDVDHVCSVVGQAWEDRPNTPIERWWRKQDWGRHFDIALQGFHQFLEVVVGRWLVFEQQVALLVDDVVSLLLAFLELHNAPRLLQSLTRLVHANSCGTVRFITAIFVVGLTAITMRSFKRLRGKRV